MNRVDQLLERKRHAYGMRVFFHSQWREQSDYFRQAVDHIGVEKQSSQPNTSRQSGLFDTTGVEACQAYAAGCMAWLSPSESTWFKFEPPKEFEDSDAAMAWYGKCTEITREILANSNFYREIHKAYLDDGAFGTAALVVEPDAELGLNFKTLRIGSYSILEDSRGQVDTVFAEFEYTARQAVDRFGEEQVSRKVREAYHNPKRLDKDKFNFVRVVVPNNEVQAGKIDEGGMPWQIVWIEEREKREVQVEGAWEMPILVHRHQCYTDTVWGFGPGWRSLPDMRQLNDLQALLDTQVESAVMPRVLAPADHEGQIDMRAGGITYFSDPHSVPRIWLNDSNYPQGLDRIEWRQGNVRRMFYNHLFQLLSEMPPGKEMTATEVMQRQRDQLPAFSPTFASKMTEIFNPLGRRAFGILLRSGAFPSPPREIVVESESGISIPDPKMSYTSRMALQIEAIENESFLRYFDQSSALMQVHPGVADHIDWDKVARGMARNEGVKEDWIKSELDVEAMRQAQAEEQARLQEQEEALAEADAAAKLGSAGMLPTNAS